MQPILLAEDNEGDAAFIQSTLKKAGVSNPVVLVSDGSKALAYLNGDGFYADRDLFPLPSVLLLDLKMPGPDGFAVLGWLKAQPHLKDILVVVLSGHHDLESINRAYALGAKSFLIKPCKVEDILNLKQAFTGCWNPAEPGILPHLGMNLRGPQAEIK